MNPDGTPIEPVEEPPKADEMPAWAQQIIDQNTELTTRLSSFEEKLAPPPPVETPEPVTDEWQPASWQDVDSRAEEKARKIVEDTLAQRDTAAQQAADDIAANAKKVDEYIDGQIDELVKANKLTAVTNENDPNDPGKLAQRELYGYALSLGTADLKAVHTALDALHGAGKKYDFVKNELIDANPANEGRFSPVSSSSSGSGGVPTRPDYRTLHNNSLDALAARFGNVQ